MKEMVMLCSSFAVGVLSCLQLSLYLTRKSREILYLNMLLYSLLTLGLLQADTLHLKLFFSVWSFFIICASSLASFHEKKYCVIYNVLAQSLVTLTFVYLSMCVLEYSRSDNASMYMGAVVVGLHLLWYALNRYLRRNTFTLIPMPEKSYPSSIIASIPIYAFLVFVTVGGDHWLHSLMTDNIVFSIFLAIVAMVYEMIVLVFFVYSKSSLLQAQQIQDIKAQNVLNIQYLDDFSKYRHQMDLFEHDLRHFIATLRQLIDAGDLENASLLLDEIDKKTRQKTAGYFCENHIINAALLDAYQQCAEAGVLFSNTIRISDAIFIDNTDLAVLLVNITSNALESCLKMNADAAPFIDVSIYTVGGYLSVRCRNSVEETPKIVKGRIETTKSDDGFRHGLGLESIRLICKKYNGSLEISANENKFTTVALLENSNACLSAVGSTANHRCSD